MTRIKVCGLTNRDDLAAAVDAGADAVGFICVPGSPRYVLGQPDWQELMDSVPPLVTRVAVCAELADALALGVLGHCDAVQFYGSATDCARDNVAGRRLVRALRVRNAASLEGLDCSADAVLLDTHDPGRLGGSGRTFDWRLAVVARERLSVPLILAGGLNPDNVRDAVRQVRPYAVDVSSGVEHAPGRKNAQLVRRFCEAVRRADEDD